MCPLTPQPLQLGYNLSAQPGSEQMISFTVHRTWTFIFPAITADFFLPKSAHPSSAKRSHKQKAMHSAVPSLQKHDHSPPATPKKSAKNSSLFWKLTSSLPAGKLISAMGRAYIGGHRCNGIHDSITIYTAIYHDLHILHAGTCSPTTAVLVQHV